MRVEEGGKQQLHQNKVMMIISLKRFLVCDINSKIIYYCMLIINVKSTANDIDYFYWPVLQSL